MNSELELKTVLTADGSQLSSAMRNAEKDVQNYVKAVSQGSSTASTASTQASAAAVTSQAAAMRQAADDAKQLNTAASAGAAGVQRLGLSAGQTAQAMRMLPAQITDITTSLASGMPIWTVAIQQGGQIKDSFGGIGPAFTAIKGAITPMMVTMAASTVTVGLATLAYAKGSAEADAYVKSIVMSGNAAGTTVSQLTSMAVAMDRVRGTQSDAADALAQLVATGQVAQANLQGFANTALANKRVLSQTVADTAQVFEELGRKPLEASVKLNQSLGYLTSATYDRIRALMEQKRLDEAGEVAQMAYSKAMDERTAKIEQNMGTIQRGWKGVKEGAAEAWDAMLGIGRKDTLAQQIAKAEKEVENAKRRGNEPAQYNASTGRMMPGGDAQLKAAEQRLLVLKQQEALENSIAATQAADRAEVEKHIQKVEEGEKTKKAIEAAAIARVKSDLATLTGAYGDAERILEAQRAAGLLTEAEYWNSKRAFIKLDEKAQLDALQRENQVLASQKATGADRIQLNSQIAQNTAEMARVRAKAGADTVIANATEAASLAQLKRAQIEYARQLQETTDARERQHQRELGGLGRGDAARGLSSRQNGLEDRYLQQRQQLDSDRLANRLSEPEYQARLKALQQFHQQALQAEVSYQVDLQTAQENGVLGMQRALENYMDSARNVAGQTERLFNNAFQSMEDGIVQFAMTGKLNFQAFAESVIADLIRIYVRQQLVGFAANVLGSAGGGLSSDPSGLPMTPGDGSIALPTSGGRAGGGPVQRGQMYPVNELGPELLTVGGRDYLMMSGKDGHVTPNDKSLMPVSAQALPSTGSGGGASAGGVNITMPVNVINNTNTPVRATTAPRGDGGFDLIIDAIEAQIGANVAAGAGPVARGVEGRYGLRPAFT